MRHGTTIASLTAMAHAARSDPPPTRVDVADPVPGEVPHVVDTTGRAIDSDFFSNAKVVAGYYDGTEYRLAGTRVRIRPAELRMEQLLLCVFVVYGVATWFVRRRNRRHALEWFRATEPTWRREFAGVGFGTDQDLFKRDGGDEFVSYVSGRRAIEHGWIKLGVSGHDAISKLYYLARSAFDPDYDSRMDKVVIDFKLSPPVGTPGARMCFAVLRRDQLKRLQESRWDLRTVTKLNETLPISSELIVMTESGDVTNALLLDSVTGLRDALQTGTEEVEFFESLIVSDLPANEPDPKNPTLATDEFRLILTLRLPPRRKATSSRTLISLACNVADVLYKKDKLVPELAISKAKKRRHEALDGYLKPLRDEAATAAATKRADELASRRKLERDKVEQRLSQMTPSERVKYKQKEDDKERKKRTVKVSRK